eukprot:GILJ01005950.1.p1 GENE.GILJ01005950.1~~GILJ01005950.1.p1  ORF type:complete len:615 (+),score=96.07 GILJ01005950.1:46-1845(+)
MAEKQDELVTSEDIAPVEDNSIAEDEESQVFGRAEYASADFWDERFRKTSGFFDWYASYRELKPLFKSHFPHPEQMATLMVGCGNSKLSEEMFKDGYTDITNIDISSVVIEKMTQHYAETPMAAMKFTVMNVHELQFPDCTFDLAVDKGTYDALACGEHRAESVGQLMLEVGRVLKFGGTFVIVTHGRPAGRLASFNVGDWDWDVEWHKTELSRLSQLINILRVKMKDKPISHSLKNPKILVDALREVSAMSSWKRVAAARREAKATAEEEESPNPSQEAAQQDDGVYSPQRQDHCFVYLLKKAPKGSLPPRSIRLTGSSSLIPTRAGKTAAADNVPSESMDAPATAAETNHRQSHHEHEASQHGVPHDKAHHGGCHHHHPHQHQHQQHGQHGHQHQHNHNHDADPSKWVERLEGAERVRFQQAERVLESLHIQPTMKIADIGAGTGFFAAKMARLTTQNVYAVDVAPGMVEYLKQRSTTEDLDNLIPIQASAVDWNLPEAVDVLLLVDVYHHLENNRVELLSAMKKYLAPNARLVIIDWRTDDLPIGPPSSMKIAPEVICAELESIGYACVERFDFLEYQNFLVFSLSNSQPPPSTHA